MYGYVRGLLKRLIDHHTVTHMTVEKILLHRLGNTVYIFANDCILFLIICYTATQLFWNQGSKTQPFHNSLKMHIRVYVCVRDHSPTSLPCWLSLWESVVTSWPRLSPALWLQGGQPEWSPADVGEGSLPCCYCFLAGSSATSLPANIIVMVSEDNH